MLYEYIHSSVRPLSQSVKLLIVLNGVVYFDQIMHHSGRNDPFAFHTFLLTPGERVGLVVNASDSGSRGRGLSPTRVKPCCVLEQGTFVPQKYW